MRMMMRASRLLRLASARMMLGRTTLLRRSAALLGKEVHTRTTFTSNAAFEGGGGGGGGGGKSISSRALHVGAFHEIQNRFSNHNSRAYYDDVEVDMDPEKMLKPGDPNTYQATIRKAMPVGYWVTMPSGREAFLPAQDLGFLGGLEKLKQLFQPGQEVTVRVVTRGGSGREVLSLKKPDPNKPDPPPKPLRKEFEGGRRYRPSSRYS